MDTIWREVIIAALSSLAGLLTALGAWSVQKAKLEQDAKAAVSASWRDLCDEQQQRIDQMRTHIEAMEARLAKTQGIAETLQQEMIVLRLENADLRVQVRTLERQHVEREGRFVALEQENERLRGGRGG